MKEILIPGFTVFLRSLRPRASSSSSQSERSASPLVMNSTQSLDIMPRFAISAEEEGKTHTAVHSLLLLFCSETLTHCVPPDSRRDGLQPAAHSAPEQQHRHQAVLPKRGVPAHRSPAGDPRETQIPSWKSPQVCLCLRPVPHHHPR